MRSPHCRPRPDRPDRADALTAGTDRTDGLTRRLDAEAATGECRPPPPRSLRATRSAAGAVARGTGGPQDSSSPAGPSRPRFGGVRPAGVRGTAVSPGGRFASRSGTSSVGISRRCRRQWLTHSFASARRRYASGRSSVPAQRSAAAPARPVPSPDSTRTSTFCTRSSASWPPSRTRPSRKAANRTRSARCSAVNVGRSAGPGAGTVMVPEPPATAGCPGWSSRSTTAWIMVVPSTSSTALCPSPAPTASFKGPPSAFAGRLPTGDSPLCVPRPARRRRSG